MTITEFLTARLDEDEAAARAVEDNSEPWPGEWEPRERHALQTHNGWVLAVADGHGGDFAPGVIEHIARHDPARVLREVEATRKLLAAYDEAVNGPAADLGVADALEAVIRDRAAVYG